MLPIVMSNIQQQVQETSYEDVVHSLVVANKGNVQESVPVIHRFNNGIYIREAYLPAHTLIVGHKHKTNHMNMLLKGSLMMLRKDGEWTKVEAPYIGSGTKDRKVAYTLEDCVWQNLHSATSTDVEEMEKEFLDKDEEEQAEMDFIDHTEDWEDFADTVTMLGFTEEEVSAISRNEEDCVPFPDGSYKCQVAASLIHGKGLFATSPIRCGEVVCAARVDGMRTPAGRYINHAIESNVRMEMGPTGNVYVVALRDIKGNEGGKLGEELTTDYLDAFLNTREENTLCLA